MPSISILIRYIELSFRALKAYFCIFELRRILGGGRAASISIGLIAAVLKTPSIFRTARFYSACRGCSKLLYPLYIMLKVKRLIKVNTKLFYYPLRGNNTPVR
jgi:hypothetical protein